jgi:hypothetical protein
MANHGDSWSYKKESEVIDGGTGFVTPTPRTVNLSNLRDVRLEMAHVYREVDAGRLKSQEGTRRVYVLRQIGDLIAAAEIEKRVVELEERYEQLRAQQGRPALPMRVN